ncbi:MAG: AI-2E family transporter, partial [Lachnospiraceae bacterium]|nr:AI-2E family transporter [Lachnospiraceae bacterium]
ILLIDPKKCLVFLIFVIILQQVDGNIIGPAILGNSIGVSSFWIIVAITVFGGFFGILGMLIGVPCFACAYAFIRRRVNKRLKRKGMSIATFDYAKTSYVSENGELVFIGSGITDGNQNNRYIELNPSVTEKGTENKSFILKIGDKIAALFIIAKDNLIAWIDRIQKKH